MYMYKREQYVTDTRILYYFWLSRLDRYVATQVALPFCMAQIVRHRKDFTMYAYTAVICLHYSPAHYMGIVDSPLPVAYAAPEVSIQHLNATFVDK